MKRWICGVLVVLCMLSAAPFCFATAEEAVVEPVPEVKAQNVLLMSTETGAVIYEKAADEQIHPASTTKIMTLVVALENCKDLQAEVTASEHFDDDLVIGSSGITVKEGEVFTVEQLLYAIAIASANDASNVLAEYVGGSLEGFVIKMNEKAAALGLKNTHFVNSHGLTADNHYTSARDMAVLMDYALKQDLFRTLMSTYARTIPATNKTEKRVISTTNSLISAVSANYYKYARGGKTGTTTPAGYNLVSWAERNDREYICVAMHADKKANYTNPIFSDSKKLYEWAFNNFSTQLVINTADPQQEVPVDLSAEKDYVVLTAKEEVSAVLRKDVSASDLTYTVEVPEEVLAPVHKGDVIGRITVSQDGILLGTTELVAGEDIGRSTVLYYLYCIRQFVSNLWVQIAGGVLLLLIIIYIIVMIRQNRARRRRAVRLKTRLRY
ncbi:MAG: D-alanyl-D-alanine carboxypeptidase [Clostridia bacterium]|nr:D-alanyl-D-alanine carboxypeptidase [Clostridia bacterium]